MKYKIRPLMTGNFRMNWGHIMSPFAMGHVADVPIFMFAVTGEDGETVIVDASFKMESVPKFVFGPHRTEEQEVANVLAANGIDPEQVGKLIITHLHHDHTGYLDLFPNARMYVQEAEVINAYLPSGIQAMGVCREDWEPFVPRFALVNGDFEIQEGLKLVFAPGHTPGHQAVAVNTERGTAVICGDSAYLYAGFAKRFPEKFREVLRLGPGPVDAGDPEVPAVFQKVFAARYGGYFGPSIINPEENMRSMAKLDLLADIIVPGHDPELLRMKTIPDDYDLE
jgi:N-acyl homoserine lactone hydrolase